MLWLWLWLYISALVYPLPPTPYGLVRVATHVTPKSTYEGSFGNSFGPDS